MVGPLSSIGGTLVGELPSIGGSSVGALSSIGGRSVGALSSHWGKISGGSTVFPLGRDQRWEHSLLIGDRSAVKLVLSYHQLWSRLLEHSRFLPLGSIASVGSSH